MSVDIESIDPVGGLAVKIEYEAPVVRHILKLAHVC